MFFATFASFVWSLLWLMTVAEDPLSCPVHFFDCFQARIAHCSCSSLNQLYPEAMAWLNVLYYTRMRLPGTVHVKLHKKRTCVNQYRVEVLAIAPGTVLRRLGDSRRFTNLSELGARLDEAIFDAFFNARGAP